MGTSVDRPLAERLAGLHEVNTADQVEGGLPGDFDLLLVELDRHGGDERLATLESAETIECAETIERAKRWRGAFVVLDRGASQQQLARAFRLGAEDCLPVALGPALSAERIHHVCRRILAERSLEAAEGVR